MLWGVSMGSVHASSMQEGVSGEYRERRYGRCFSRTKGSLVQIEWVMSLVSCHQIRFPHIAPPWGAHFFTSTNSYIDSCSDAWFI